MIHVRVSSGIDHATSAHPGYADLAAGLLLDRPEDLWMLQPWQAAVGLVAWVLMLVGAAIVMLRRRDG